MKKKSKKQVRKRLTAAERKRLVEAVTELTTTLEWTVSQLARHLGYTTPRLLYRVRNGSVDVDGEKFREIMRLYEGCVLPSEVLRQEDSVSGDASRSAAERETDVVADSGAKKELLPQPTAARNGENARNGKDRPVTPVLRKGRKFPSLLDTPIVRRVNQGLSIFVYLQSARDQLEEVVVTFEHALDEASNVLTAPGVRDFQKRVRRIQRQLDEALAMS